MMLDTDTQRIQNCTRCAISPCDFFHSLVTAFRESPFVVHRPLLAVSISRGHSPSGLITKSQSDQYNHQSCIGPLSCVVISPVEPFSSVQPTGSKGAKLT